MAEFERKPIVSFHQSNVAEKNEEDTFIATGERPSLASRFAAMSFDCLFLMLTNQ